MSGKLLSLFQHPEFVRRAQARAAQELAEHVLTARPIAASDVQPPELDALDAFLDELFYEK